MGGWILEAPRRGDGVGERHRGEDVLDLLSRLVDNSLVVVGRVRAEEEPRTGLEPVASRREKLEESDEVRQVRRGTRRGFRVAKEAAHTSKGTAGGVAGGLEKEHDNLRARYAILAGEGEIEAAVVSSGRCEVLVVPQVSGEGRRYTKRRWKRRRSPEGLQAKALFVRAP